jgi:hypothetical protein
MTTETNPALLRLLVAFAAVGCGAGAIVIATLLAVNVLA